MSDSRTASGLDRLPWLTDEPKPRTAPAKKAGRSDLTGWAAAALLLVAGLSFWLGTRSETGEEFPQSVSSPPAAPAPVPQASTVPHEVRIAPQPEVAPVRAPEVRPAPAPDVRIAQPARKAPVQVERSPATVDEPAQASAQNEQKAPVQASAPAKPAASPKLIPWPPRVVAGASGRLVQVGAYGSRIQAKRGWWAMARAYPAMQRLPAVVVVTRNSQGRLFYRFQVGTTSQAHSEVLCQRMEKIDLSCAIVGLPWKAKVER
jgi:outer membrane biosynthesis protein TonB